MKTKEYFEKLDIILAGLGILFAILLLIFVVFNRINYIYIIPGLMVILSCFYWLSVKKKLKVLNFNLNNPLIFKISSIIFFILLSIGLVSLYLSYASMERSLHYFILVSFMAVILFIGIIYVPKELKTNIYFLLTEIIVYGLFLTYSQLFITPGLIGVDTWYHQMFTQKIISINNIPQNYLYSNLPIFHLIIAETSVLLNINYKLATLVSISFIQVFLDVIVIYIISIFIVKEEKVGLLAGLLLVTSNVHLSMGFAPIPNTLGLPLLLLAIYLLFKNNKYEIRFLVLLLMFILVLTHSIAALITSLILFLGFLVYCVYDRFSKVNIDKSIKINIAIFFAVLMFGYWIYASGIFYDIVNMFLWGYNIDKVITQPEIYLSNTQKIPFIENSLTNLGMFSFFALSLIGSFFMISTKNRNPKTFFWVICGLFLLVASFIATASGTFIITGRWIYIAFAFVAIPLAFTFFIIILNSKKHFNFKLALSVLCIALLTFFMVISPVANKDNNELLPNSIIKTSLKTSELTAIDTVSTFWTGYIRSDSYYSDTVIKNFGYLSSSFDDQIYSKNITTLTNAVILIRTRMYTENIDIYGPYKIDYDIESLFDAEKFMLIYDSGTVKGFLKMKNKSNN